MSDKSIDDVLAAAFGETAPRKQTQPKSVGTPDLSGLFGAIPEPAPTAVPTDLRFALVAAISEAVEKVLRDRGLR